MLNRKSLVILVCGEGGHNSQMIRLLDRLDTLPDGVSETMLITDSQNFQKLPWKITYFNVVKPVRDKNQKNSALKISTRIVYSLFVYLKIAIRYKVKLVISTGPGIAVVPSSIFRLLGAKVIHVETWSRFYTASLAGKAMYRIANIFYVQNKEQLKFYPNSTWSGRL